MQDKVTCEYAVIRLVPKVEREEFMNVGVILYSKSKRFLAMKYSIDAKKLAAFNCDFDSEFYSTYLQSWEQVCRGNPKGGRIEQLEQADRFRWLAACRSTMLQCSKTHPGLTNNPQETLDQLFELYVG